MPRLVLFALLLEGVVLDDGAGTTVTIESLTWEDVRLYNPLLG